MTMVRQRTNERVSATHSSPPCADKNAAAASTRHTHARLPDETRRGWRQHCRALAASGETSEKIVFFEQQSARHSPVPQIPNTTPRVNSTHHVTGIPPKDDKVKQACRRQSTQPPFTALENKKKDARACNIENSGLDDRRGRAMKCFPLFSSSPRYSNRPYTKSFPRVPAPPGRRTASSQPARVLQITTK